jgi:hypothetical protein
MNLEKIKKQLDVVKTSAKLSPRARVLIEEIEHHNFLDQARSDYTQDYLLLVALDNLAKEIQAHTYLPMYIFQQGVLTILNATHMLTHHDPSILMQSAVMAFKHYDYNLAARYLDNLEPLILDNVVIRASSDTLKVDLTRAIQLRLGRELLNLCGKSDPRTLARFLKENKEVEVVYDCFLRASRNPDASSLATLLGHYQKQKLSGDRETEEYKKSLFNLKVMLSELEDAITVTKQIEEVLRPYYSTYYKLEASLKESDEDSDASSTQESDNSQDINKDFQGFEDTSKDPYDKSCQSAMCEADPDMESSVVEWPKSLLLMNEDPFSHVWLAENFGLNLENIKSFDSTSYYRLNFKTLESAKAFHQTMQGAGVDTVLTSYCLTFFTSAKDGMIKAAAQQQMKPAPPPKER